MNWQLGGDGRGLRRRLDDARDLPRSARARLVEFRDRVLATWAGYSVGQRASSVALTVAVVVGLLVGLFGGGGADRGDLVVARDLARSKAVSSKDSTPPQAPRLAAPTAGDPAAAVVDPVAPSAAAPPSNQLDLSVVTPKVLGFELVAAPRTGRSSTTLKDAAAKDKAAKDKAAKDLLVKSAFGNLGRWIATVATQAATAPVVVSITNGGAPAESPTTRPPTTSRPGTTRPTTTERPTTTVRATTTVAPTTTVRPTTVPATAAPTTAAPTTAAPTTAAPTTAPPTEPPTTAAPPTTLALFPFLPI